MGLFVLYFVVVNFGDCVFYIDFYYVIYFGILCVVGVEFVVV